MELGKNVKANAKEMSKEIFDEQYLQLISKVKPDLNYYEQSFGDKLLFFRRVDKLKYDIVEEEKLRKERQLQLDLQKARDLRAGGGGVNAGKLSNQDIGLEESVKS